MDYNIGSIADAFGLIQRDGFIPETMIWADPPGMESGTWILRKGEEPKRLADTEDFDRIWMTALGITSASIEKFSDVHR